MRLLQKYSLFPVRLRHNLSRFYLGRLKPDGINAAEVQPQTNREVQTQTNFERHGLEIRSSKESKYERASKVVKGTDYKSAPAELQIHASRAGMILSMMVIGCGAFQSCDRDKNNPGYDYFPDMAYSRAYETYAPNPNFADRKSLQAPVEGTISREGENYPYKKTDADMGKAAKMKNPFSADSEYVSRGQVVYNNVCLQCHGPNADGKGHLFTSGKYPYPPASLISQKIKNRTDGEIFHVITVGYGIMAPHQIIVRPDDRWKVVLYVRSLQRRTP